MHLSRDKSISNRSPGSQRKSHIIQHSLNKKSQLLDKYQSDIQDLIQKIDQKQPHNRISTNQSNGSNNKFKNARRNRVQSTVRKDTLQTEKSTIIQGSMKDYQKLILGLEYALESQRKKVQILSQKNNSLQSQISNLRNVLVGPDESKQYQKTVLSQTVQKVSKLEQKIIDQKKNYQFIIQSKNQALTNLESQLRTLRKSFQPLAQNQKPNSTSNTKQTSLTLKILQLMTNIEQLRTSLTRKNIQIQALKYKRIDIKNNDQDQDDQIQRIRKVDRIKFYMDNLEIANNMIMKKNIEILNLSNKINQHQQVNQILEMYLDKKQVKNIDLSILQTPLITKLRILLREKATFQRELLGQLNQHNKVISTFQSSLSQKQSSLSSKLSQCLGDNKKLSSLVSTFQLTIQNLQKSLNQSKNQSQYLKTQIQINKKQFVEQVKRLKNDLGTISNVTKNQFDRMKIQNLKLNQQNRSLLFLVGEKQREIHTKGNTIKTFQDYRSKINSLDTNISHIQTKKIQRINEDSPQIGSKLLLVNNFSGWMFEWNKIKSWNNKKVLLNLILDKEQIRVDSYSSMGQLIQVIHQCLLQSKNIQIQQRGIILLHYYLQKGILKSPSLYLSKISALLLRGFRPLIQSQQQIQHNLLNQSTLKILNQMQKIKFQWNQNMDNQMLAVNGLKYLFAIINQEKVDDLVEMAYNVIIMITRTNHLISFMISFNITEIILKNIDSKYQFIIFLLELLRNLLKSDDYMRVQKSFLEFRKLTTLLKVDEQQDVLILTFQCLLLLLKSSSSFIKNLNKLQTLSLLTNLLKSQQQYPLLKPLSQIYSILTQNLQQQSVDKFINNQVEKVLKIIHQKNVIDNRFTFALRITLKLSQDITQKQNLDERVVQVIADVYHKYPQLDDKKRATLNHLLEIIYERNKNVINKYSNDTFLNYLVEAYMSTSNIEQINTLLKILLFQNQQKHTTELLRAGRQNFIDKLCNDSMSSKNYQVSILALKNLLSIARQKYVQKFINIKLIGKIINKVLKQRSEQEYLSLGISVLYFLSKNQQISSMALQSSAIQKVTQLICQNHSKQALLYKCFALIELLNSLNYKKKCLNYYLTNDPKLQILKTFNYILRRAQNKIQMGARAVFFYDFLVAKQSVESLTILMQNNTWMVEDFISMRNQYIGKVDSLVYKVQLILNSVCQKSKRLNKLYQKFKIQGDVSQGDEEH